MTVEQLSHNLPIYAAFEPERWRKEFYSFLEKKKPHGNIGNKNSSGQMSRTIKSNWS